MCMLCKGLVSEVVLQLDAQLGLITQTQASNFSLVQHISTFFKVSHGRGVLTYVPAVLSLSLSISTMSLTSSVAFGVSIC